MGKDSIMGYQAVIFILIIVIIAVIVVSRGIIKEERSNQELKEYSKESDIPYEELKDGESMLKYGD